MSKKAEELKNQILEKVAEYFSIAHKAEEFVAGETRLPYGGRIFDEKELVNLVDSSLEFWLTYGRFSKRFERGLGDYLGIKHCILVNSGSSANLLAVATLASRELGQRRLASGDEVITVASCFPTTIAPLIQYGLVPVFVDITLPAYNIDTSMIEAALSPRTRAVMLAHTLGNPFDIDAVTAFCKKHGLWLIEDNCDALGSLYNDKLTGTFGDIGTSSFYPPHHITMGEGGAVYTDNTQLARLLASMRDWGRDCFCPSGQDDTCKERFSRKFGELPMGYDHKYVFSLFGYNLRVTDLQASIGCAQLEKLPRFVEARRRNFRILYDRLKPLEDRLILPQATKNSEPSWFGFPITIRDNSVFARNEIVEHLEKKNIQTRMLFAGNILKHPCFDYARKTGNGARVVGGLENTDIVMNDTFWIGVYPGLTEQMLHYMADEINGFFD